MKLNNPFVVRGYCGPEYVCDREKEPAQLIDSLVNESDVALIAPRHYGKFLRRLAERSISIIFSDSVSDGARIRSYPDVKPKRKR